MKDDAISRRAVLKLLSTIPPEDAMTKAMLIQSVKQMDAAQPEPRWIPCGERLPEYEKEVLVTQHFLSDKQLKKNAITESFYVEVASRMDDEWTSYSDEYNIKKHLHKVIAWMPLPEPYKGDEQR